MTIKLAIFIPMKGTPSKRVPQKNFRSLGEIPLLVWTLKSLEQLYKLGVKFDLYIDTESDQVFSYAQDLAKEYSITSNLEIRRHFRSPIMSEDSANGNHLLQSYIHSHPQYPFYLQTHITTPFTSATTYKKVCDELFCSESVYSATYFNGWIRQNNYPINYDCTNAEGLGRSQDKQLVMETTDTYGVSRNFFDQFKIRTNETSKPIYCSQIEAIDIDTEIDFIIAESIAKLIPHNYNYINLETIDLASIHDH